MPRPALTEEQRRETRRRIREAAAELYATRGLAELSARAVAEKAGVSVGTIYSHFGSLPELSLRTSRRGEDTLMWGSDYPHTDSTWPCSAAVLDEMFEDFPKQAKNKIVHDKVKALYGL